jgi:phosphohistidine phosphatase
MKTLFLLRHAKSSLADSANTDFERPLTGRGKKDAEAIGSFMMKQEVSPDLVLSSPAVRARETIGIVIKATQLPAEVRYDQRIYEAGPLRLLEVISEIEEERSEVLVVGHNPGMEELLQLLTGDIEHMATGTLLKIDLRTAKWSKAADHKGNLAWLVKPKELPETS